MQRECNDVAFGELILSTRLNKKKKRHPMSKIKDVVKACNSWTCRCRKGSPPQEGVAFTTVLQRIARVFTNQYVDSSTWTLLWRFWTSTIMCQTSQTERRMRDHCCKTASRCVMMTMKATWSWCVARRLRKDQNDKDASTTTTKMGCHTSWQIRKRKWWLIWQLGCRHARHWRTEGMQLDLDW